MSEFLGEARVLIVPDTKGFAEELRRQLLKATSGITVPVNVVATGAGVTSAAAAAEGLSVATREAAVAQEAAGVAAAQNARATAEEAKASTLAAAAAKQLAFAQTEVEGASGAVGAAQIRNTRSAAAVAAAEKSMAAALASTNLQLEIAAAAHLQLAEAEHANALAALENARAQELQLARSSQIQRAFLAQAAGAAGLRGAVLSSTAAFLGATVAAVALGKSIKGASDLNEEINKTVEVFGASSDAILEWSETTSSSIGTARVEALSAIGTFGELFRTLGVGTPKAAALSKQLVTLGADLASFFNTSNEQALQALQSGLVGQARPLRQFGVFLTEARVKAEALIETGKKNVDSLTQQDRILARYNLILQDAAIASGDFERTQGGLANQARKFRANISDLGNEIGGVFLPNIEAAIQDVNKLFFSLNKLKDFKAKVVIEIESRLPGGEDGITAKVLGFAAGFIGPGGILKANLLGLKAVGKGLDIVGLSGKKAGVDLQAVALANREIARDAAGSQLVIDGLAASLEKAAAAAGHLNSRLNIQALTLEAQNAPLSDRIAKQKEIVANDEVLVRKARKTGRAGEITAALNQQIADQNELESLQKELVSNQEDAVSSAQDAADKISKAQLEATEAFLEAFDPKRRKQANALIAASLTEGLGDDIKIEQAIVDFLKQIVVAIQNRIKKLHLTGDALKAAKAAIDTINQEIFQTVVDIQKDQAEAFQAIQDTINKKLDLKIQIAQAQDNVAAELRARRAKLAQITKELVAAKKAFGKNSVAWLELKAAQAEQIAAIKELENQNKTDGKDAGKSAQQFFFEQLQAQQGFASNLLGNLIPRDQTAGLVGNPSPTTGPGGGISIAASVQEGKAQGGPSAGQASTTNELLHRILQQLKHLNGTDAAPEARRQRRQGTAIMDGGGGNVDVM